MISTIRIKRWHVAAIAVVTTIIVAMALAVAGAEAAKRPVNAGVPLAAPLQEPVPVYPGYKGWGYVSNGNYSQGLVGRFAAPRPVQAWEWNANTQNWMSRGRSQGTRVYIWPYATSWSWTWTQETGWYAMQSSELSIGYRPIAVAT